MSATVLEMSMSLDGYVTGPNDSRENPFGDGAEMLHDWILDAATDDDRAILQATLDGVGAIVMGRTSFDKNEGDGGWGDAGPVGETPCFVVTHDKPTASHPRVFTFVTDGVASAIEQAKAAADDNVVGLFGATIMQQALPLGLVDEIRVHVIPVLLSRGGSTPEACSFRAHALVQVPGGRSLQDGRGTQVGLLLSTEAASAMPDQPTLRGAAGVLLCAEHVVSGLTA